MPLWGTEQNDQARNLSPSGAGQYTGAQILVRFLEHKGVRQLFGIPGAAILPFYDAVLDSHLIRSYNVRHEQTAVFMADGFSRATGKVGVCAATSGPGATNFLTGLYGAYVDSIPLIALTGQVPTSFIGKDAFQEAPMVQLAGPVTKKSYFVGRTEDLPGILRDAWLAATTGRRGPVLIDLPLDVQKNKITLDLEKWLLAMDNEYIPHGPRPSPDQCDQTLGYLRRAERPVILAGGGIVLADAVRELQSLAERLSLPVVTTLMGKDCFPNDHPLYAGMSGTICQSQLGNKTVLEADLILNLGGRFSDRNTGDVQAFKQGKTIIHVNIDSRELNRQVPTELAICADVKEFIRMLLNRIAETGFELEDGPTRIPALALDKTRLARKTQFGTHPIKPQEAIAELRKHLERNAIVTHDCGISQILSSQLFEVYEPRTFLITGRAGTMGWGLGAAMAAKLAKPEVQCVNILGDGSLGMSLADLATAAKHRIPVIIFLLNNSLLGLIRQQQNLSFNERWISTDLDFTNTEMGHERGIDFVTVARGLGVAAERIEKVEEIGSALQRAFASQRPYLLEVLVDPLAQCSVSEDGTLAGVIERN